jgi:hypothetical protein
MGIGERYRRALPSHQFAKSAANSQRAPVMIVRVAAHPG